jgi:phosphoribosyl 1,2-cyclic phosphodiesterase
MLDIKVLASGSKGNCYTVNDGRSTLAIECGLPFKQIQQLMGFRTSELSGLVLSHEHLDHAKSANDIAKAGIDIYASAGTFEALGLTGHRLHVVRALEQFTLGTWAVLPFDTVHDAKEPLGFLLASQTGEKLLYLTDTAYCRYRFEGLTHLMVECNYAKDLIQSNVESGAVPAEMKSRIVRSHFSLENVKGFLRANDLSQVQEIHLIHCSDANSDAERFKREIQELTGKPVCIAG